MMSTIVTSVGRSSCYSIKLFLLFTFGTFHHIGETHFLQSVKALVICTIRSSKLFQTHFHIDEFILANPFLVVKG